MNEFIVLVHQSHSHWHAVVEFLNGLVVNRNGDLHISVESKLDIVATVVLSSLMTRQFQIFTASVNMLTKIYFDSRNRIHCNYSSRWHMFGGLGPTWPVGVYLYGCWWDCGGSSLGYEVEEHCRGTKTHRITDVYCWLCWHLEKSLINVTYRETSHSVFHWSLKLRLKSKNTVCRINLAPDYATPHLGVRRVKIWG